MPKGVDSTHPIYDENSTLWVRCRTAVEGQEAVKKARDLFLPKLLGQSEPEYAAYLHRAYFYEASGRTVDTFSGMVMRRDPTVTMPASMQELVKSIGDDGEPLVGIAEDLVVELITTARAGLLVDSPAEDGALPYICLYYAENILNWVTEKITTNKNGKRVVEERLIMVVLKEKRTAQDGFKVTEEDLYRVLSLEDGKRYKVQLYIKNPDNTKWGTEDEFLQEGDDVYPTMPGGRAMDFIPFVFTTPSGVSMEVVRSPILGVVNVNISHYMSTADLEHGRHFTALPTAYVTGADRKELGNDLKIGSAAAWIIQEPAAKVGFLEFTGAGLGALQQGIKDKENQMAVLGARMLKEDKRAPETVETLKEKGSGEGAVLSRVAKGAGAGLTKALQIVGLWLNANQDPNQISVALNQDFGVSTLDGQTLAALLLAMQSNGISWKVYHHNLRAAGLIPDNITEEQEAEFIKEGPPVKPLGEPAPNDGPGPSNKAA